MLPFDGAFNFSRVNNLAVEHSDGEVLVFLNNDTEVETPGWLEALVSLAERTAWARSGRCSSTRTAPCSTPASCWG